MDKHAVQRLYGRLLSIPEHRYFTIVREHGAAVNALQQAFYGVIDHLQPGELAGLEAAVAEAERKSRK